MILYEEINWIIFSPLFTEIRQFYELLFLKLFVCFFRLQPIFVCRTSDGQFSRSFNLPSDMQILLILKRKHENLTPRHFARYITIATSKQHTHQCRMGWLGSKAVYFEKSYKISQVWTQKKSLSLTLVAAYHERVAWFFDLEGENFDFLRQIFVEPDGLKGWNL